jgi:outer membrane protein OmpA-like peptidoglycan-associated protein
MLGSGLLAPPRVAEPNILAGWASLLRDLINENSVYDSVDQGLRFYNTEFRPFAIAPNTAKALLETQAQVVHEVALRLCELGRLDEAIQLYERDFGEPELSSGLPEIVQEWRATTARALTSHLNAASRLDEALKFYSRQLQRPASAAQAPKAVHENCFITALQLINNLQAAGRLDEALQFYYTDLRSVEIGFPTAIREASWMASGLVHCASRPMTTPPIFSVFFDWGQATLTDSARRVVQLAAGHLESLRGAHELDHLVEVNGHTDTSGTSAYNFALSVRRAEAVADELVGRGVHREIISIHGFGDTDLRAPTEVGVREPDNRRVEIIIRSRQHPEFASVRNALKEALHRYEREVREPMLTATQEKDWKREIIGVLQKEVIAAFLSAGGSQTPDR